jgi:hypothetical protein
MTIRIAHRSPGIALRSAARPAHHLGEVVLESGGRDAAMRRGDARIGIQPRIGHDTVDQIIDDGRDVMDAAKAIVERGLVRARAPGRVPS